MTSHDANKPVFRHRAWYEFTLTNGIEVMLVVDLKDGSTLDLYTYENDRPWLTVPKGKSDERKEWNPRWRKGENNLFVHAPKSILKTFAEQAVENEFLLRDDLGFLIQSAQLPDTIFKNPIIAALRDRYFTGLDIANAISTK